MSYYNEEDDYISITDVVDFEDNYFDEDEDDDDVDYDESKDDF